MNKVEETITVNPCNSTMESHYVINTIVNGSMLALNNHVGSASLKDVKLRVNIHHAAAPLPNSSESMASSTESEPMWNIPVGGGCKSSEVSLSQHSSLLHIALFLTFVLWGYHMF